MLQEAGEFLFGDLPMLGVVSIPHALNTSAFRPNTDNNKRPIDIGARVARYAPHLGDNDRNRIADQFTEIGRQRNFTTDISNQRFDRDWLGAFSQPLCRAPSQAKQEVGFLSVTMRRSMPIRKYLIERAKGIEIANDSLLLRTRIPAAALVAVGG